jgi:PAS domain S-box-containing protein
MNQGIEILIADDTLTEAEQLKRLLEERGFAVVLAANGQEALAKVKRCKPALIICDIAMPAMDGYTLCKRIKSNKSTRDTPVVIVTTFLSLQELIKGLECGADNFMRKPYDEKSLLSCISSTLANRVMRKSENMRAGAVGYLIDQRQVITSERQQILDFLISTYEHGVLINEEPNAREKRLAFSRQCLNGLTRIAETLNRCTSEQEVAAQALQRALELPGVQAGWISLQEGETGFRMASAHGLPPALQAPGALEGHCLCRRKLLSGELIRATNILECERLQMAKGDTRGLRYHASIPLWIGNRTVGIMNLAGPEQGVFSDEGLEILHGVGNQIGMALERARLYEDLKTQAEERTAALTAEIAERTHAQESQRRLVTILDATPDFVAIADADKRALYLNAGGRTMIGVGEDEDIAGFPLADGHPEWARALVLGEGIPTALRDGVWSGETALLHRSGREIPVSQVILAHKAPNGVVEFLSTIARDITEHKRAEATRRALYQASLEIQTPLGLQERLDRLLQAARTVLELDRVNVLLADPAGQWLEAVASLGVEDPLEVIRVPIGPAGGSIAQAYLTQRMIAWDGQGSVPGPLRLQPPYDRITALRSKVFVNVPLLIQGRAIGVLGADRKRSRRPFDEATGEILQLFAAQAAIAIEQARLYEAQHMAAIQLEATVEARTQELQETLLKAEAASRAKSDFLANMSHELRTPLNSVLGFSELLQQQAYGPLTEKQARYVEYIHQSGQHLLSLINDLLDLTKVQAGKIELRPQTFVLREALAATLTLIRPQAEAKSLRLQLQEDEAPATLVADPLRFKQILFNLLSNAVKFTPRAGRITVTARKVHSSQFMVEEPEKSLGELSTGNTEQPGEFVEIAVQDTGIGIKAEDLPKLFQPFTQLESKLVKQYQGTGLGLALTKQLVELHGGTIRAESAGEGKGSVFGVRLPLVGPRDKRLILVVDDDEALAGTIRDALEAAGYQVDSVGDGATALERVASLRPDLVLLDLELPRLDGSAVLRQLRTDANTQAIPVLVMTGVEVERGTEVLSAGANEFLTKPFSMTVLESTVRRLLRQGASAQPIGNWTGNRETEAA